VPQEAWLTIVLAVSGVVAIAVVMLAMHILRPSARVSSTRGPADPLGDPLDPTAARRRRLILIGGGYRLRGQRSVEDNFERAYARIDAVDPYLAQRRIGDALAEVGLVSSVFDEPADRGRAQPFGEVPDRSHQWEDEA